MLPTTTSVNHLEKSVVFSSERKHNWVQIKLPENTKREKVFSKQYLKSRQWFGTWLLVGTSVWLLVSRLRCSIHIPDFSTFLQAKWYSDNYISVIAYYGASLINV